MEIVNKNIKKTSRESSHKYVSSIHALTFGFIVNETSHQVEFQNITFDRIKLQHKMLHLTSS